MENLPIAEAIRLAVAPIFLLAGIGALLNVMTARLGRVVDRARLLEGMIEAGEEADLLMRHQVELAVLGSRIRAANRAIYTTSISALFVCFVVALLFVEELTSSIPVAAEAIAALFILTMAFLTLGLAFFLREIAVASRSLQVRSELLGEQRLR
ncbi:DUF2721 domain-containing protein [Parvularcula maris]|uniref:DUF2721 domain-containing protein n=1 Tax=Parvularcula maris TaxID=2965077 RepID=A0A9X2RHI3_9PROT|nr:DUF2721 domain-containing protein [Parvularcula maris]MCQ8183931.1 DUF2721 domain-containing protein [Parvularcula maris]